MMLMGHVLRIIIITIIIVIMIIITMMTTTIIITGVVSSSCEVRYLGHLCNWHNLDVVKFLDTNYKMYLNTVTVTFS